MIAGMRRIPELDGLRGFAALGIVWYHIRNQELFWYWTSMDMFFVLSSFLITRIALHTMRSPGFLFAFYARRITRIWPLYFLVILGMWLFQMTGALASRIAGQELGLWTHYSSEAFLLYLTFTQNIELYFHAERLWDYPSYAGHLWSLAVEEQYYLLAPLVLMAIAHSRGRIVAVAVSLAGIGAGLCARMAGQDFTLATWHLDAFVMGGVLAFLVERVQSARGSELLTQILIAGAVVGATGAIPYLIEGYSAYLGGAARLDEFEKMRDITFVASSLNLFWTSIIGLLAITTNHRRTSVLRTYFASYLGRSSYALYLCHVPILAIGTTVLSSYAGHDYPILWGIACLPVIFGVTYMLYKRIDRPIQQKGWLR